MGSLTTDTLHAELTAALEFLDHLGVTRDDVKRFLKSGPELEARVVRLLKHGLSVGDVIDCDALPAIPREGWKIESHRQNGPYVFDPSQVEFYISGHQKHGVFFEGTILRLELANKPVLNANALDYLLANVNHIPDSWKTDERGTPYYIFFHGTTYLDQDGKECVRYLFCKDDRWQWHYLLLNDGWYGTYVGAMRAS